MLNRVPRIGGHFAVFILLTFAAVFAEAGGRGTDVVAMGGGYIDDAEFVSGTPRDITFSFFIGFDKHDALDGAFQYKIVVPGQGTTFGVSTGVTDFDEGGDDCPWVQLDGTMNFHGHWAAKLSRGEHFRIKAWDCDGFGGPDSVQIWIWRSNWLARNAQSLDGRTDLTSGNVMIR